MKVNINKKNNDSKELNKNEVNQSIYCISCFNKNIWEDFHFKLSSNNEEVISVKTISQNGLLYDDNFKTSIHQIDLRQHIKKLKLLLINEDKKWDLKEITISNKENDKDKDIDSDIILFVDLDINPDCTHYLLNDLNPNSLNEKKIDKLSRFLKTNEKLDIFLNYFKQNKEILKKVKLNLVKQFIGKMKDDNNKSFFSSFIKIFNLSFGTKAIANFLKCYPNINFDFDKYEDEEFKKYVKMYEEERNNFFSKNNKYFQKGKDNSKVEEYKNLLENFIIIYKLFYNSIEDIKEIDQEKIKNVKPTLKNLIKNKTNLIELISFILKHFDVLCFALKSEKFKIESDLSAEKQILTSFINLYNELVKLQDDNSEFFLDFSPIFNYLVDEINEFENLIKIKSIYKKELSIIENQYFKEKIKEKIHKSGMEKIKKGDYDNLFLILFIKRDKEYEKTEKEKFSILKKFKVELMDENFFTDFNKNKIYSIFEIKFSQYLESFAENIKEIKDFGLFFKLLPPDKYDKEAISFVVGWVSKNINTFNIETCNNFKKDVNTLLKIMADKTAYMKMDDLIKTIIDNIGEYSLDIFIYVLNSINNNEKIIDILTKNILKFNDDDEKNDDIVSNNLYKFIKEVNPNKLIKNIFFSYIKNIYFEKEDFKDDKYQRFNVFEKLLNNDSYSIFNEDNKNKEYWENTLNVCKAISKDLKELNISYEYANYLFYTHKEKLKKRILSIFKCLNEEEGLEIRVIENMNLIFEKWKNNLKKIEILKEFNNFIYKNKELDNRKLSEYNKKIYKSTLKYLNSEENLDNFSRYKEDIEKAQKVLKLRNSSLFLYILKREKKNSSELNLLDNTFFFFDNIKKIFVNVPNEIENELKNNSEAKLLINLGCLNEENLIKEIDWLLEYFSIYDFDLKDFLIERIKIFIKNKSLSSVLNGIIKLFDIFKDILNFNNIEDTNFNEKLIEYNKSLSEERNITIELLERINRYIEDSLGMQLNEFNDIFNKINKFPESMEFIKDKRYDELRNMNEFLLESDNEFYLNEYDINDFIKVVKFFEEIVVNRERINNFKCFVKEIIDGVKDNDKCGKSLCNYIDKYNYIQILLNKYLKHTEGCIKKIKLILEDSDFNILLKQNEYILEGKYSREIINENNSNMNFLEQNNSSNNFNFLIKDDLELLYKRIYLAKIPEKYKEMINKFNNFYKGVKQLINIFNILYSKGYQETFNIKIIFKKSKATWAFEDKETSLEDLINKFLNLQKKVIGYLNKLYEKNEIIRFFYGRQFYMIYNNLIGKNEDKNLHLFKVISSDNIKQLDKRERNLNFGNNYYEIMEKIGSYVNKQLEINKKKIKNIYEFNEIKIKHLSLHTNKIDDKNKKKENEFKGVFFHASENYQQLEAIYIYSVMTFHFPINSCFLYCTNDISIEELNSFLKRCFLCEYRILFCMINVNLLKNNLKKSLIHFITKYSKNYGAKMESCLLIIFSGKDEDLHNILLKLKVEPFPENSYFDDNDFTFKNSKYKSILFKSRSCGLGKSEFIKKNNENKNYIYFPIGGEFKKEDLFKRLEKEIPDTFDIKKKYLLHLDLSQSKEIELLNEFFFKLLILRKCELKEDAKYFGENVEIIIEIPNDFSDYFKDIKILSKLEVKTIDKLGEINNSNELQKVAEILEMNLSGDILKTQSEIKKLNLQLSHKDCQKLIFNFLSDIKIAEPNYYQIKIFIKVLYDEFSKFIKCPAYFVDTINNNALALGMNLNEMQKLVNLRKFIINSFVKVTKLMIIGPYEDLIKSQRINQELFNLKDDIKEKTINTHLSIKIDSLSFDKIKPSLVVFNEDGNSCSIITTCPEEDDEFKNLQNLYNLQNPNLFSKNKGESKLKSFRKLNSNEILDNLLNFLNVSGFFNEERKREVMGSYVYTPDNFIKVVLILMRIRAKIPIIMMGETGCGKTTLIEMASKLYNKGKSYIKKLNIHAGITDIEIEKFMKKTEEEVKMEDIKILNEKQKEFENLSEKNQKAYNKENLFKSYKDEIRNRKIWIFFDEINTSNSMGLLTEIICKNTMYGKTLDNRYIFIAACNPYRVINNENIIFDILYKKTQKKKSLVYTVNPLPHSLLNFVFNFGSLKGEDECKYIESMIKKASNALFGEMKDKIALNEEDQEDLIEAQIKCVMICQNYMKSKNDVSIVSLREVKRFNIFFKTFVNFLYNRKNDKINGNYFEENNSINYTEKQIYYSALNLSLFVCYYLRLPDKKSRDELANKFNNNKDLKDLLQYFSNGDFTKIPMMEEDFMLNNFEIPRGIARNRNLKENIFILFFCIVNKIPLITCGKPGRSKTLSFQILQNSMKGEASNSPFCKKYPELIAFKIQGSLSTTSKEIEDIFKKAREKKSNTKDKNVVVYMDEMGLAEISENNPLKVMHSELETEDDLISFVGISNWFIDASKMNRVIYNVVQDPDENDIIETGMEIAKSYEEEGEFYSQKYQIIIQRLSKAYYNFINKKKKINDENQYFHGSRDFYCLIKSVMNDIISNKSKFDEYENNEREEKKNKLLNTICLNNIMRNFAGLKDSIEDFKSYFFEGYEDNDLIKNNENKYNLMKCLQDNINDDNSRYLLLITDSYLSQDLLNYILEEINLRKNNGNNVIISEGIEILNKDENKEVFKKYYNGSKFKSDKNNILYYNDILSKIKYQMETDNILILKDLESVYPSLYELFNQSFIILDGKKFVHLGESKSLSLVNDKFKAIVLVENDKIKEQEPPFLNRFEKHIINFKYLLDEELLKLSEEIFDTLQKIKNIQYEIKSKELLKAKLERYFYLIKEEEIKGLVYIASKKYGQNINDNDENGSKNKKLIIKFVLEKIAPCFNEYLMIMITKFGFRNKYNFYYKCIFEEYEKNYCCNLKKYLEKLKDETSIVYTFSSIIDDIFNDDNEKIINNSNIFSKEATNEIRINTILSMEQIDKEIVDFIFDEEKNEENKNTKNLLILKFKEQDLNKFNDIYNLLNDYRATFKKNNPAIQSKFVIFIVYLKNEPKNKNYLSFLSNCPQIMISNFNNTYENFPQILKSSNEEIIKENLMNTNSMINNNIDNALRFFTFRFINYSENILYKEMIKFFIQQESLRNIVNKCLISLVKNEEDFFIKVLNEEITKNKDLDENYFMNRMHDYLNNLVFNNLRNIIYILEKEQIINIAVNNEKILKNEIIEKYINNYIEKIGNKENMKFNRGNRNLNQKETFEILIEQKLPLCENIIKSLFNYVQNNIKTKYLEKEEIILKIKADKNNKKEQEKYLNEMKKLESNLIIEIDKYPLIIDILNSKNEKLISDLFEDCFYIFFKNCKLPSKYLYLTKLLNLLIQLRLRTRMNNNLDISFIDKDEIQLYPSFMDLIKEEIKNNEYDDNITDDKNNIYIKKFACIINFLQSYSKEIHMILELYFFLLIYFPNLENSVKKNIETKKVIMEEDPRSPSYTRVNKLCFFYIIESLCNILKEKILLVLKDEINFKHYSKQKNFLNSVQYNIQNLIKIENRFILFSKEIFNLEIIGKIIVQIQKIKNYSSLFDLGIEVLKILFEWRKDNFVQHLQLQYMMIMKLFKNDMIEFNLLMNKILFNYYISEYNKRESLIKDLLLNEKLDINNHNELLEYSYPVIELIFKFSSLEPQLTEQKSRFIEYFEKGNTIKKLINDKNNPKINEILLYRFEIVIDKYFQKILKKNDANKLCGNISKTYLEKSINYFYQSTNDKNIVLNNICKLYCIAYIKRYMNYLVEILFSKDGYQKFSERESINIILFMKNVPQKKNILFYCLKILLKKLDNNWEAFKKNYNEITKDDYDIYGFKKYNIDIKLDNDDFLLYIPVLLMDNKHQDYSKYNQLLLVTSFSESDNQIFANLFLENNSYEYLYTFLSNIVILIYCSSSNLEHSEKRQNYIDYLSTIKQYLNTKDLIKDKDILDFFNTFFDIKFINEKIIPKFGKENDDHRSKMKKIIILFYGLRFIFSILVNSKKNKNNKEGFYFKLLTKKISLTIDDSFIPGNFPNITLKVKTFDIIKKNLIKEPLKYGAFVCSCGYHYSVGKCTFPTMEMTCPVCKKKIGGKKHILFRREGHIRIFFDENSKNLKLNHSYSDKDVPYKYLNDYENEVKQEKNILIKGIKPIDIDFFKKKEESYREIADITYRFLNFILFSFLFYSNIKEFIKDKDLKKYIIESMTCFDIIETNWDLIQEILGEMKIEVFLNLIFDEIIDKFIKCSQLYNSKVSTDFEKDIDLLIKNKLSRKDEIENYKKINNDLINISPISNKSIIQETYPSYKYPEDKYPDFKYFYLSEIPGKENFIKSFNSREKNKEIYPILNSIINDEALQERIKLMKELPKINKLCNHMINYVSFKYSREEAKNILVKEEIKDEEINKLVIEFIKIYGEIRPYIKQEGCHEFGELYYDLKDNLYLSNLCVDSGEMGFGLVLLAMYKEMINWQNSFINMIINSPNEYLKNYKDLFDSKIMIQDCEEDQILFLPNFENENMNNSNDKKENINLMEIISDNSHRKDNKVIYNYDEIEKILAAFILPKIKYFKEDIRKVIYQYECFVGDRSSIIVNFTEKYQQRKLTDEELKSVINYIKENQKNNKKFNIKNFLFSFQVLIDVILDQSPHINNTLLSVASNNKNLSNFEMIINFFTAMKENGKENNNFTISTLINLFEVVELYCWNIIRDNLDKKYLQDINENIKMQIDTYFAENLKNNNNIIISKIHLCSAIRKFISRYLSGKSDENINPKNQLKNYLINSEFWPINFAENDVIDDEINQIFGNVDIELAHSVKLYDHLGGDKIILDDILKKINLQKIPIPKIQIIVKDDENQNNVIPDNNQIIENAPENNSEPPHIDQNPPQEENESNEENEENDDNDDDDSNNYNSESDDDSDERQTVSYY